MTTREEELLNFRFKKLITSISEISGLSETKTGRGALNRFVSGLVLSSAIMEEIRGEVQSDVKVSWGQILDENDTLSGEIDIMTYLGKPLYQWESIGYAIVRKRFVGTIFEVKRSFKSYRYHERDCQRLRKFCPHRRVLLIIYQTRNTPKGIKRRMEKLKAMGYDDVFQLVRLAKQVKEPEPVYEDWHRLMDRVSGRSDMSIY